MLDEDTRRAARELAAAWDCGTSEAIRRAIRKQHAAVCAVGPDEQAARSQTLNRLFSLFDGDDADAEVERLKLEDECF